MELTSELKGLCLDRLRLMRKLGPTLLKAGYKNPNRKQINRSKSRRRKELRRAIQLNGELIASYCMQYFTETKIEEMRNAIRTADSDPIDDSESLVSYRDTTAPNTRSSTGATLQH